MRPRVGRELATGRAELDRLKTHEAELRRLGVRRLALFGSAARGEAGPGSDVDLLASFDPGRRLSLIDVIHVENRLSDILGRRVDLIEEHCLEPRAQPSAKRDLILAFSLDNIARIERHTAGMDEASFRGDAKTVDAVEPCLARISEAAVKLEQSGPELCPDVRWRDIRGIGNHLRHDYRRVDLARIRTIVERDLPSLKAACLGTLAPLRYRNPESE